ncbi:hypothetical protein BGX28_003686 [Mortierella sp. GBA30]|nr:hypothetical protein BGX28_003686 [Mortierella sp. GBA30]
MRLPHGVPDLVCLRAGSDLSKPESVLFPIEIKRPALLRSENLIVDLMTQEQSGMARGSARALNQTFGYMRLNGYRYGVLSTYEQTWFLQREGQGTNDLVVSPTIAFDRTEPSLLQCYLWFVRQANADVRDLDPPSDSDVEMLLADENRPGDKRAQDNSQYRSKKSRFKDSISSLFSSRKTRSGSNVTAQMVVPAFVSMQLISHDEGAQTYKASWQGCDVIVKKCDIWNERPVKEELKHEAEVYQILRNLQGRYIPKLRITGIADGMEMILVTDYVGTDISQERLDASDQEKIRAALYAIHDLGVVHGDIQPHNILVQREGRSFYFVDFGLSQINPDMAQRQRETALLGSLLRRMAA